jgi:hypothetical protein
MSWECFHPCFSFSSLTYDCTKSANTTHINLTFKITVGLLSVLWSPSYMSAPRRSEREQQRREFERAVTGSTASLSVWRRYLTWAREAYVDAPAKLRRLYERATGELGHTTRYRDDDRFVRIWLEYVRFSVCLCEWVSLTAVCEWITQANEVDRAGDDSEAVFRRMYSSRIGRKVALFYMAWANVLEHHRNFAVADQVYKKGLAR